MLYVIGTIRIGHILTFQIGLCMKLIWDMMEKPETSLAARILNFISLSLIIMSTIGMCISTFPIFAGADGNDENPQLAHLELVCIVWFTVEFILRFFGAPQKWAFLKNGMNIIDILAILPYFVSFILIKVTGESK